MNVPVSYTEHGDEEVLHFTHPVINEIVLQHGIVKIRTQDLVLDVINSPFHPWVDNMASRLKQVFGHNAIRVSGHNAATFSISMEKTPVRSDVTLQHVIDAIADLPTPTRAPQEAVYRPAPLFSHH